MQPNLITDEGAENIRRIYSGWLEQNAGGLSKYEAYLNLGLLAWRSGDAEQARGHLQTAARTMVDILAKRDLSQTEKTRRPSDVEMAFMLAFVFGDRELKSRLAQLPRRSWFQPEDDEYLPLANLLEFLGNYVADSAFDRQAISAILLHNRHPRAHWFYKPRIQAMCQGLLALEEKDDAGVGEAVAKLLEYQREEALEGDWKYLVEGLMDTWASVLYMLAEKMEIAPEINSPYLYTRRA